jgi:Ca-activated chloride channel family protein
MEGSGKIGFVRDGLELLIDSMHDEDELAIITYSDLVIVEFDMDGVADNRSALREIVRGLTAGGGTNLHDGLERGFLEVLDFYNSGRQNRVILLSDGLPSSGITDETTIMAMSRGYNSEGIGLTTVGLGTDFNTDLMRGLAEQGDGNFYFVENASAVDEVFTEEISYFTVPVAFDLEIEVVEGDRYELGQVYGSTFWEDTESGGRLEVPSVFLAHRVSADDVTDGGGRRGGGSALLIELMPKDITDDGSGIQSAEVARIEVSFREPGTDEIVHDTISVVYPYAPWLLLRSGYFGDGDSDEQVVIQKSFVMLNIYVALETATQTFYNGAPDEAIGILERLIAAVEDFNDELEDTDMDFDLELMRTLVSVIEANGGQDPLEEPDEDPWPAD